MKTLRKILPAMLAGVMVAGLALPVAADVVRGHELLTPNEWQSFRSEMQTAQTPAERDAVRQKIRQLAETRAAERGDVLMHQAQTPPCGPRFAPGMPFGPRMMGPRGGHWGWGPGPGW